MYALAAGLVNIEQTFSGKRRIFSWYIAVHIDIVMVKIERDLKIIDHAIIELLAETDDAVVTMLSELQRNREAHQSSAALAGGSRLLLRVSRQNPTEIRKTV